MVFSPLFWYVHFGITSWRQATAPRSARLRLSKCPSPWCRKAWSHLPGYRLLFLLGHRWTVLLLCPPLPFILAGLMLKFLTFWTPGSFLPLNPTFTIALLIDFLHFVSFWYLLIQHQFPTTVSHLSWSPTLVSNTTLTECPFLCPLLPP